MSYDLHVYCAAALEATEIRAVAEDLGQCRVVSTTGPSRGFVVERKSRTGFDYGFNVDGPLRVERDDLPDAVVSGAVGVRTVYQLSVEGSNAAGIQLASRFARGVAQRSNGVVYDPQQDAIVFPRGGTRRFKPEPTPKIDLVQFRWFVRREDATAELPAIVFDSIRSYLPEALPRRFGAFEPLQGRLEEAGKDGFVAAWRAEPMSLFWKGSPPCLGGSMNGLGDELLGAQYAGSYPVGTVGLSFDHRAFLEARWREDAVALFVLMSERLSAFFGRAEVDRRVGYSRGNIRYGPDARTNPGLVVRNVWMGLPCFGIWLAWFGSRYRAVMGRGLPPAHTEVHEAGALVRTSALPLEDTESEWRAPKELLLKVSGGASEGWTRERAHTVPDGL